MATLVLITGTGRSGTSTISGMLHHLGLSVPGPYLGANESNPKGFFESRWAVRFHKRLASAGGFDQFDARPQAIEYARAAATPALREELVAKLDRWAAHDQVVVKDPRSIWAQQLWRDAAAEVGRDIRFVSMLRHPAESLGSRSTYYLPDAASEASRRAYEILSAARWINNQLVSERETRGEVRSFVQYTDLLADWRPVATGLRDDLGLSFNTDLGPAHHAVDDFIEPGLRRHQGSWDGLGVPPAMIELSEAVWAAMVALGERPRDTSEQDATAALDACSARYADMFADAAAITQDLLNQTRLAARRAGAASVPVPAPVPTPGPASPLVGDIAGRELLREVGRRAARRVRRSR